MPVPSSFRSRASVAGWTSPAAQQPAAVDSPTREALIRAGLIRPAAHRTPASYLPWLDSPPTLRIDRAGTLEAERRIANPRFWNPDEPQNPKART